MKKSKKNVAGLVPVFVLLGGELEMASKGFAAKIVAFFSLAIVLSSGLKTDLFGSGNGC
jgi:hypothetical protein